MNFVEERIHTLEAWLADQPDNETLQQKKEEYDGLWEELHILTKKLKKTARLLLEEEQKEILIKLARKQEQYSHEIEDIVAYVEQDVMFTETEMDPSDLLGVPLETLVEQPGMEGSSGNMNFSVSDLPYMPPKAMIGGKSPILTYGKSPHSSYHNYNNMSHNSSSSSSTGLDHVEDGAEEEYEDLHPIKEDQSSYHNSVISFCTDDKNLNGHDTATLRKKLKKVETMLANTENMDKKQRKKLEKKREEYSKAIESSSFSDDGDMLDGNKSLHSFADSSVATMDVSTSSLFKLGHQSSNNGCNATINPKSYDKRTLQKKLKKVKSLLQTTTDEEKLEKFRLKEQEYQQALDEMANESSSSLMESMGSIDTDDFTAATKLDDNERRRFKTLQKKLQKAEKLIAEAQDNGDKKRLMKLKVKREEYASALEELQKSSPDRLRNRLSQSKLWQNGSSTSLSMDQIDQQSPMAATTTPHRDSILINRKIKKLDQMIDEVPKGSKEYKKFMKKRKEYLTELGPVGQSPPDIIALEDVTDPVSITVSLRASVEFSSQSVGDISTDFVETRVPMKRIGVRASLANNQEIIAPNKESEQRIRNHSYSVFQKKLAKAERMLLDLIVERGEKAETSKKYTNILKKMHEYIAKLEKMGGSNDVELNGVAKHLSSISTDEDSEEESKEYTESDEYTEEDQNGFEDSQSYDEEIDHVEQLFEIVEDESERESDHEYQSDAEHSESEDDKSTVLVHACLQIEGSGGYDEKEEDPRQTSLLDSSVDPIPLPNEDGLNNSQDTYGLLIRKLWKLIQMARETLKATGGRDSTRFRKLTAKRNEYIQELQMYDFWEDVRDELNIQWDAVITEANCHANCKMD